MERSVIEATHWACMTAGAVPSHVTPRLPLLPQLLRRPLTFLFAEDPVDFHPANVIRADLTTGQQDVIRLNPCVQQGGQDVDIFVCHRRPP